VVSSDSINVYKFYYVTVYLIPAILKYVSNLSTNGETLGAVIPDGSVWIISLYPGSTSGLVVLGATSVAAGILISSRTVTPVTVTAAASAILPGDSK